MQVEFLRSLEEVQSVREAWDELARLDRRDGFFRSSGWYLAWLTHVRQDAKPFVGVVRNEAGQVIGIAPLCRMTFSDVGFKMNAVSSAGREIVSGDYLGFVGIAERRAPMLEAVMRGLWDARKDWELLILGETESGGDLAEAMQAFAGRHGLPFRSQEPRICPYIELPTKFDQYLAGLSGNMRYKLRRDDREITANLHGVVEIVTDPQDIVRNLDILVRLHLAHWNRVGEPGTLSRPGIRPFLEEICRRGPANSSARLYVLRDGESPAAALLSFVYGDCMLYYQMGWDPDSRFVPYRPGYFLLGRSIRDAVDLGLRYYDFLRGDETYKSRFTQTFRRTETLLAARSLLAQGYLRALGLKDAVKRALPTDAVDTTVWKVS